MTDTVTQGTSIRESDGAELLKDFVVMSSFGATAGGGVDRQAGTAADGQTRDWFVNWLTERDFRVEIDAIGNIFGLLEFVPGAPYVLFGSHLDSQPLAGRYDGAYGVLAAAHCAVRARRDLGTKIPRYNIAVVDWFNEEGSRFKPSMMGSGVFTDRLNLQSALSTLDPTGISVADVLDSIAGRGTFPALDVVGYGEIHVEQGRGLDDTGIPIGVVASTWCAYKYEIVVSGEQSHTGSTMMRDRKDALLGASRLVVALAELTEKFDEELLHTSVGQLFVLPNSPVTVAREVRMLADLRARESSILNRAFELLTETIASIQKLTGVTIEIVNTSVWESGPFLEAGLTLIEESSQELGYESARVLTVAGHDATNMKDLVPTVLVFIPSVDGVSHNEKEFTKDSDLVAGAEVFTSIVKKMALGALTVQ